MEERLQYLFKRYLDNSCSRQEMEEFFSYVNEAQHNEELRQLIRQLYQEIKGTPLHATFVDAEGKLVLAPEQEQELATNEIAHAKRGRFPAVLMMALLLIAGAGFWFVVRVARQKENRTAMALASHTKKTTDRSEYKYLVLEDSTKVWLNAASALEFPDHFNKDKREVYLSGEAYFDVMHADKTPFIIHTGSVSTTVLGTAFNIKAYPGEDNITVAVSRGKVKVTRSNGWTTTLNSGDRLKLEDQKGITLQKVILPADVAAWQQGNIVYDDETLKDIIADMERVYNISVELPDPSVHDLKISTAFKKEIGAEQALQVLCKLIDMQLKKSGNNYSIQ